MSKIPCRFTSWDMGGWTKAQKAKGYTKAKKPKVLDVYMLLDSMHAMTKLSDVWMGMWNGSKALNPKPLS